MKLFIILLSMCFASVAFAGIHNHHRWGVHLEVTINLQHPDIAKSKKAPEKVLVEKAKEQSYALKVIKTERKDNILLVEVVIRRSADKGKYIKFLRSLGFVKDVTEVRVHK